MRKTMALMTIGAWLVAGAAVADGGGKMYLPDGVYRGRLSAEEAKSSLVPITTEAAMRNGKGEPIYDCLEPHISKFGDTWYAYGFTIREKDVFAATCYSSTDLKTWIFRAKYPVEKRGIPLWNVLYNAKNKEYVGYGAEYGDKIHVYTSPSPIGPFTYKKPMSAVHGGPGDLLMYPDTDGKAYLIYNKYQGEIPQRFAYIYQLTDDYYDIVPSTLCNTSKVMEGFWMIKRNGTYFLLGSGLVAYDVDDNFYLTAPSPLGPWTDKGYIAPVGTKTFKSQTFQGLDVTGPKGTAYVFIGHRWKTQVGGLWANATSIWLPLKFTKDNLIEEMKWYENWLLDTEGATLVPPPPPSRANPQASSTVNGESAPANAIDSDPATGWSSAGAGTVKSRESNVISRFEAKGKETLSGFYARLSNCVGPVDAPTVVGLRVNGALRQECVTIPVYGAPLNEYTRQNGRIFPPLDVAQEYRIALAEPLALKTGDKLNLEIISSGAMTGGGTAGLQFEGTWNLADMREPFRQTKAAGPVSRIAWSDREVVGTGTEKKFDPMCAAQNNSTVAGDPDGTLWQFTAFYSVDEQYGGGRDGSYARIFGFKKPIGKPWEPVGLVVDCPPQTTYAGDPFAFQDMDGTPCLAYGVADGSNGFSDWKYSWGYVRRSKTKSFAGPWGDALPLWEKFPRSEGRMVCVRVYPRPQTRDYLLCWDHGESDIKIRGAIVTRLGSPMSHKTIVESPTLIRNQEEGSGGFIRDGKGYLCGWQIPGINDVTAIQRLHEFDLADPLNPQNWRVVPGSWGFNDGSHPVEDGGASADSWSLSLVGDELWASSIVYSMSEKRNSILACHVPWEKRMGNSFRFGVSRIPGFTEVAPVIEYALGKKCGLRAEITGKGDKAWAYLFLSPSARPLCRGGFAVEVSPQGSRLVWYPLEGAAVGLTPYGGPKWTAETTYKLVLQRDNDKISGTVDGFRLGPVTITDPAQKQLLDEPQRFKFYGWQGGLHTIQNAILQDGQQ